MWKNLILAGRLAAFPLAFAIIVLGVEARTETAAPVAPAEVATQPLDLANARAGWLRDHAPAQERLAIALR